ncbi:MAG: hypothetical protein WCY89_02795 [Flavobacteriaceae bacterium]
MKKIIAFIILIVSFQVKAQQEKFISASIGYGLSSPYDEDTDVSGKGIYLQGEYVMKFSKWIDVRPYAGLIFTESDPKEPDYEVYSKAFLIGGKLRLTIPIPLIAPYIEMGAGMSIAKFKTITVSDNIDKSGAILHLPFSLGLQLGTTHKADVAFTYYYHESAQQFAGAVAIGILFPLD